MTRKLQYIIEIACFLGLLGLGLQPASGKTMAALPSVSEPAPAAGDSRPVRGWVAFCERNPAECTVDTTEPQSVALTHRTWQQLIAVNMKVNTLIKPLTDEEHWGLADLWDFPTDGYGDCEDYQLLKRKLLVEAGFPRRALRMTVVLDEKGEGHAVLMIRTDRGDFILDNKVQSILPWHQTGYIYVKREGHEGSAWVSLGGATSPITTANR